MDQDLKTKLKFRCVLFELLKSDFKVTDDTILEKLITHLSDKEKGSLIIDASLCTAWARTVLWSWQEDKTPSAVASFALRLMGIIVENECDFNNIQNAVDQQETIDFQCLSKPSPDCRFLQLLRKICATASKSSSNFSVKCALIQFLASLLKHSSGRRWIMASELWKEVHEMGLIDSSVYVVRETRKFFSTLLNEMPVNEENDLEEILSFILVPFFSAPSFPELASDDARVLSTLHLIVDILEKSFLTTDPDTLIIQSRVCRVLSKNSLSLLQKSLEALKASKGDQIEELLSKVSVLMYILDTIQDGQKHESHEMKAICLLILDVFNELINKGSVENVLKLCVSCHNFWTHVAKVQRRTNEDECNSTVKSGEEKKYRFEDQLLCLQMLPLYVGLSKGSDVMDDLMEVHIQNLTSVLSNHVLRMGYVFRSSIVKQGSEEHLALFSVRQLKHVLNRERAVLVFQSFIYVLKHFVLCAESETKQAGWGGEFRQSHHSTLLVAILDGLASLVQSHRITWRESVESLCLLTLAQELLNSPTFSSKVGLVVQALRLIQLCIENFMPPNLALLTNTLSGTSLDQLGPLIYKRLHDPHWEVRDSSLEVLLTLATISHTKYPLFQELILDHKLCEVVVHLALNDSENYVCASATKCLTAMVRVDRLWNEELCDKDLVNKMIGVLSGESEGVLRREASLLMSEIFKYRKVAPDVLQKMCQTMANVVLSDLHWEVKVNALSFWELIIEHQMNNQGMIDGVFPQVTFSKEHRKIINLTPSAIQERLKKVLNELSQNGCLHVLLDSIRKDEDLEVVKKAAQIIMSLTVVLERHGLSGPKTISPMTPVNSSGTSSAVKQCSSDSSIAKVKEEMQGFKSVDFSAPVAGNFLTLKSDGFSEPLPGKSILDLDPQLMGFAALDDDGLDLPSVAPGDMQDKVIDSILNDRDINLLAKVYLGVGAEVPGRQGPETKISKPSHPLVVLSSDDFLRELSTIHVDKIVEERTRWVEDTGSNLDILLDDMLITRNISVGNDEDDCNAMDCY